MALTSASSMTPHETRQRWRSRRNPKSCVEFQLCDLPTKRRGSANFNCCVDRHVSPPCCLCSVCLVANGRCSVGSNGKSITRRRGVESAYRLAKWAMRIPMQWVRSMWVAAAGRLYPIPGIFNKIASCSHIRSCIVRFRSFPTFHTNNDKRLNEKSFVLYNKMINCYGWRRCQL